jgi:DNA-binding NtrC family response regulator
MSQPYVLVVDDEPDIRELVQEILADEGYEVAVAENGEAARAAFARRTPDLVLLDIWMPDIDGITLLREWSSNGQPDCPVVVMSGHGNLETAVEATRLGAYDFVQKPISLAKLLSVAGQAIDSARKQPRSASAAAPAESEPIGNSQAMQSLRKKAEQAARHHLPVLISGEQGCGRANLARFIHARGVGGERFVCLDHGRVGPESVRSYLHGSSGSEGLFERARGGTLFIPDLQDLPDEALEIIRLALESDQDAVSAGSDPALLDCRLIASACKDPLNRVPGNEALSQLYFRLNVLPLEIPPLRERPEDVPELIRHYAEWFPNNEGLPYRPFSVAAQNRLRNHDWPGNVLELRNLVQQVLVLGGSGEVTVNEVEEALKQHPAAAAPKAPGMSGYFDLPLREARERFEHDYLVYRLRESEGSVGRLAEMVGMERTHLYRKLRALGIDPRTAGRTEK